MNQTPDRDTDETVPASALPRKRSRSLVAVLLLVVGAALALGAAGCGSSDDGEGIPADGAAELDAQLAAIAASVESGECLLAREQAREFVEIVNALPGSTGTTVKQQLRRGGRQLQEIVLSPDECEPDTVSPDPVEPLEEPDPPAQEEQPTPAPEPAPEPQPEPDPEPDPDPEQPVDPPGDGGDPPPGGGGGALSGPVGRR